MKKTLLFLFLAINHFLQSQTSAFPDFINYQAVLRDVNGVVLPAATSGQLTFKIYDDLAATSPSYEENHNFVTNTVGLVNVKIGNGTPVGSNTFANVNWSAGKACYEVFLNGNSIGGKQAFATVPYAIYARNSGGALPTGSANQTLYWDGGTNKWIPTSNLNNNGTTVGIGVAANPTGSKLHVFSNNVSDSSVIFSVKNNSVGRGAAIRAYGLGSTNSSSPMTSQAIYGLDSYGGNGGTGPGVGVSGYGSSSGYAYGVVGIGSVNSATASAIGLYGGIANGANNSGSYAAYFNGKTFIGDSLIYFPTPNAYAGKVLTMQAGGFAAWRSLASIPSASINLSQGGIVNVNPIGNASSFTISAQAPVFSNNGIGTIVAGAYPNYALNVPAPSLSISGNSISIIQGTVIATQTIAALSGLGTTGYLPQYSTPNSFSITNIFRDNNSRVGFNTTTPKTMLHLVKQSGSDTLLLESQTSASMGFALKNINNRFGMVLNGTNFKIEENGVDRMIFSSGNVGIGTLPLEKLHVNGNVIVPAANDYLYSGTKTRYSSVSASAFNSQQPQTYDRSYIGGHLFAVANGGTVVPTLGLATYFVTGVNLPDGATVTAVSAYVVDEDATYNISVAQLWRGDNQVATPFGTTTIMADAGATTGSSPNIQLLSTNTISVPVINNQIYNYYLRFGGAYTGTGAAGQNIRLGRFLVTYIINKAD